MFCEVESSCFQRTPKRAFRAFAIVTIVTSSRQSRLLQKQRENAGIPIQPVVGNLAVAEKSNQWKITERLTDHAHLLGLVAEEIRTARYTGIIQAAARAPKQPAPDAVQHARHVL